MFNSEGIGCSLLFYCNYILYVRIKNLTIVKFFIYYVILYFNSFIE